MDFEAEGRKMSHDAACGPNVNNEPIIADCSGDHFQKDWWRTEKG